MLTDEGRKFLEINFIKNYTFNPDGTVDVNGNVAILTKQSKLPVKFGKVEGYFSCDYAHLTSLEGSPSDVGNYFSCSNNKLTSLAGAPSRIGGDFYCHNNILTSLHDIHKLIREIDYKKISFGNFYCNNNLIKNSVLGLFMIKRSKGVTLDNKEVQMILNKYLEQGRSGIIAAQQKLFDAGLDEYARL